jgi:hypothetical protein
VKQTELKQKMPQVAAFIDSLCEVFGKEAIHAQIRKGLNGAPTFYAQENGYEIGTHVASGTGITWHAVTGCAIDIETLHRQQDAIRISKKSQENPLVCAPNDIERADAANVK